MRFLLDALYYRAVYGFLLGVGLVILLLVLAFILNLLGLCDGRTLC